MSFNVSLTIFSTSIVPEDVTSPETITVPVVANVSQATREFESCERYSSNMASDNASHTLSG